MSEPDRPRVLYITGWLRSGSTMLGNVLGELPGVLHVGELHYLWRNGVLRAGTNSTCGCGSAVTACRLWSAVLDECGSGDPAEARRMTQAQDRHLRTRHTRARLAESGGRAAPPKAVGQALDRTVEVYRALARHGAGRLVVDSSKYPAEAAALLGRADVDVRVLHIVRDPRATAFSYQSAKDYIDPMGPARSSGFWTAFNVASELVGRAAGERYLRIRHEDLCRAPHRVVEQVIGFAAGPAANPVDAGGRVRLRANHTVTGNPDRLSSGLTVIRGDERWRAGLSRRGTAAATAAAVPLLGRYGYPLRPGRRAGSPVAAH